MTAAPERRHAGSFSARLAPALPYLLVGTAAAYLFYAATQMEFHRRAGSLGPDFWPKLILGLIIATCAYEVVKRVVFNRQRDAAGVLLDLVGTGEPDAEVVPEQPPARPLLLVSGIVLTAVYVWSLQKLGFALATAPYVAAFVVLGGYRRWLVTALVSVVGTLAMMFFFMKVVYVSLPIGIEPFAQVTLFLMRVMGIR